MHFMKERIKGIEQYKHYLGPRYKTFLSAFDLFVSIKGKVIVELGTTRSFVPGGVEGCAVNDPKYWDIDNPGKWDWGAGIFTRMCALHLEEYQPEIHTVDISSDAIDICKVVTSDYSHLISYHEMKSEDFLKRFRGKIDLLYMDSGESGEQADILHLTEAQIALSRSLFSENAIILIDDVNIPGKNQSKGRYSIPFLNQNGFHLKIYDYQILLQRDRNKQSVSTEDQFALATTKLAQGDYSNAMRLYEELLIQRPGNIAILTNLALAYGKMNKIIEAKNLLCQLVAHAPDNGMAVNNLGKMYLKTGQIELAIDCFQKALQLLNHSDTIASNFLFSLNFDPKMSPDQISHQHIQWGNSKKLNKKTYQISKNDPIRIGYVLPDDFSHELLFFFKPILRYHDRSQFKIFCYANISEPDTVIKTFQAMHIVWRDILNLSDTSVIRQIQKDEIDILVDLAGHTPKNRLSVFAQKPAPVQVSYLGYPGTTGLQTIDYRLTDIIAGPPSSQEYHTEKLIYLSPCYVCYEPHQHAPAPKQINSERITFGSFHHIEKINQQVVQNWSTILNKLPNAQLFLKSMMLHDEKMQQFVRDLFKKYDVLPDRLVFSGFVDDDIAHLELYHTVDIVLDTFPYNGTTTTFESLWMGVPVLTLAGNTYASCIGKSILTSLGLTDLIATSESDYIDKAIHLAKNKSFINTLRSLLRPLLMNSHLLNAKGFVQQLEALYQEIRSNHEK